MHPIFSQPWAIIPERLAELKKAYDASEAVAFLNRSNTPDDSPGYENRGGVAVVPIMGVLTKNTDWWSDGTAMNEAKDAFRAALDDPSVHSIVLHIDSPGGTVDGTQGLASVIESAGGQKPITAFSDGTMASAAYWIGSAADKVYISGDTVHVGSIGVVAAHVDVSRLEENFGVKVTEITAGKYKRIASMHAPLSEEGRSSIQDHVDHLYGVFVDDVAKHRSVSVERALEMADGRVFIGRKAVDVGLVDGIRSLEQIISEFKEAHMTRQEFAAQFPADYQAIIDEGKQAGHAEGLAQGRIEGAEQERERIRGVEAQALPGFEAVVSAMKFDGKSTGPDVAMAIIAVQKEQGQNYIRTAIAEAPLVIAPDTPPLADANPKDKADDQRPVEERAKEAWDKDKKLRAEFRDHFDAYLAYEKATEAGHVRILGKKA